MVMVMVYVDVFMDSDLEDKGEKKSVVLWARPAVSFLPCFFVFWSAAKSSARPRRGRMRFVFERRGATPREARPARPHLMVVGGDGVIFRTTC